MKRIAKIVADDGEVKVSIAVRVLSRNGLTPFEVRKILQEVVRLSARHLDSVSYTDLGPENTRIEMA